MTMNITDRHDNNHREKGRNNWAAFSGPFPTFSGVQSDGLAGAPAVSSFRVHSAMGEEDPGREPEEKETVKEASSGGQEVEKRLFDQRKVLIFGGINDRLAREVTARLLALAGESDRPIDVYVNSPGGHVESGDTIHDMIRFVDSVAPVNMIGTGWVASAGALIFAAGRPARRLCLPNTRFLLHQPMGGVRGPATDIDIEAREIIKMRERLNRLFARETGQDYEKIARDTDRNYWMSAREAVEYGLVSRIISSASDIEQSQ